MTSLPEVDRKVFEIHGSYWDTEEQAAKGKSVLLVEGDSDKRRIEKLLKGRSANFANRVRVIATGGRAKTLQRLSRDSAKGWSALVDRDTWTEGEVASERKAAPQLWVTDGWTLENEYLTPERVAKHHDESTVRESWVRAGALWWVLQRGRHAQHKCWEELGETFGAPPTGFDLTDDAKALELALIRKIPEPLRREAHFNESQVAKSFDARLCDVRKLPPSDQWRLGVHGKAAFARLFADSPEPELPIAGALAEIIACLLP